MKKEPKEKKAVMTAKCVCCGNKEKGLWTEMPMCPKCYSPMVVESIKIG